MITTPVWLLYSLECAKNSLTTTWKIPRRLDPPKILEFCYVLLRVLIFFKSKITHHFINRLQQKSEILGSAFLRLRAFLSGKKKKTRNRIYIYFVQWDFCRILNFPVLWRTTRFTYCMNTRACNSCQLLKRVSKKEYSLKSKYIKEMTGVSGPCSDLP